MGGLGAGRLGTGDGACVGGSPGGGRRSDDVVGAGGGLRSPA